MILMRYVCAFVAGIALASATVAAQTPVPTKAPSPSGVSTPASFAAPTASPVNTRTPFAREPAPFLSPKAEWSCIAAIPACFCKAPDGTVTRRITTPRDDAWVGEDEDLGGYCGDDTPGADCLTRTGFVPCPLKQGESCDEVQLTLTVPESCKAFGAGPTGQSNDTRVVVYDCVPEKEQQVRVRCFPLDRIVAPRATEP